MVQDWAATERKRWAAHLAGRLALDADALLARPGGLVHALYAEMFASAAENVSVFFTDLFGFLDPYNVPGTISDENWSLRLAPDFERQYAGKVGAGEALCLPRALALALGARGADFRHGHAELIAELERLAAGT